LNELKFVDELKYPIDVFVNLYSTGAQ